MSCALHRLQPAHYLHDGQGVASFHILPRKLMKRRMSRLPPQYFTGNNTNISKHYFFRHRY